MASIVFIQRDAAEEEGKADRDDPKSQLKAISRAKKVARAVKGSAAGPGLKQKKGLNICSCSNCLRVS